MSGVHVDVWRFQQIGLGVSRCPIDADQELLEMNLAAAERRANPLVAIPGSDGKPWIVDLA